MNVGVIGEELRRVFTEYLYPTLVIGIFLFLLLYKLALVFRARGEGRIRRLTAAILPFLVLIFFLLPVNGKNFDYPRIEGISTVWQFISGVLVAVAILELGRWLKRLDAEVAAATYILFIALVDTYMLYSMIENSLGSLHFLLLGMVIGGGFYVIFRGVPLFSEKKEQSSGESEGEGQRFEKISRTRPIRKETPTPPPPRSTSPAPEEVYSYAPPSRSGTGTARAPVSVPPSEARKKHAPRNYRDLDGSFEDSPLEKEANPTDQADS